MLWQGRAINGNNEEKNCEEKWIVNDNYDEKLKENVNNLKWQGHPAVSFVFVKKIQMQIS